MKITLSGESLKSMVGDLVGMTKIGGSIPDMNTVRFYKNEMGRIGVDMSLFFNIGCNEKEQVTIGIEQFAKIAKMIKEKEVIIEDKGNKVRIQPKGTKKMFQIEKDNYGELEWKKPVGVTIGRLTVNDIAELNNLIKFAGTDELRPVMSCVCIREKEATTTDAHRLRWVTIEGKVNTAELLIPRKVVQMIKKWGEITVREELVLNEEGKPTGRKWMHLVGKDQRLCYYQDSMKFPNWRAVVPTEKALTRKWELNRKELIETVGSALVMANATTHEVRLRYDKGNLIVSSEDLDYKSEFKDEVEFARTPKGERGEIGFNGGFLVEALKQQTSEMAIIRWSEPNKAVMIDAGMLLMPVMLNT